MGAAAPFDPSHAVHRIASARSFLFVPGDRPDRFDKARAAGADMVILDLEDAVPPAAKVAARTAVMASLSAEHPVVVRINAADTAWFADDLALCAHPGVAAIMLPKSVAGSVVAGLSRGSPVIALVESARGILDLDAIAATPGVARLAFGSIDLALDLDMAAPETTFDPLRLQMVVASRANGLPAPIDGVTRDFRNAAIVSGDVRHARTLGLTGKLCIHPGQIAPTHSALRPSDAELALARRILEADAAAEGGAISIDGAMVDRPVVERARALLMRH